MRLQGPKVAKLASPQTHLLRPLMAQWAAFTWPPFFLLLYTEVQRRDTPGGLGQGLCGGPTELHRRRRQQATSGLQEATTTCAKVGSGCRAHSCFNLSLAGGRPWQGCWVSAGHSLRPVTRPPRSPTSIMLQGLEGSGIHGRAALCWNLHMRKLRPRDLRSQGRK